MRISNKFMIYLINYLVQVAKFLVQCLFQNNQIYKDFVTPKKVKHLSLMILNQMFHL